MLLRIAGIVILALALSLAAGCGGGNGGDSGSSGSIQGTVVGTAGQSATLSLDGSSTASSSVQTGAYGFSGVGDGYHDVSVSCPGFYGESKACYITGGQTATVDFSLITDDGITPLLRAGEVMAASGTFTVPITITNAEGIAGFDLALTYNHLLITAVDVEPGSMMSGFSVQENLTEGRVAISMANPTGISQGSGVLANITFTVNGGVTAGQSCSLRMVVNTLYNESIQPITHLVDNGSFTVY